MHEEFKELYPFSNIEFIIKILNSLSLGSLSDIIEMFLERKKKFLLLAEEKSDLEQVRVLLSSLYYFFVGDPEITIKNLGDPELRDKVLQILDELKYRGEFPELEYLINEMGNLLHTIQELELKIKELENAEKEFLVKLSKLPSILRLEYSTAISKAKETKKKALEILEENRRKLGSLLKRTREALFKVIMKSEGDLTKVSAEHSWAGLTLLNFCVLIKKLVYELKSPLESSLDYKIYNPNMFKPVFLALKTFFDGEFEGILTIQNSKEIATVPYKASICGVKGKTEGEGREKPEEQRRVGELETAYSLALLLLLPPPKFSNVKNAVAWLLYYPLYQLFLRGVCIDKIREVAEELLAIRRNSELDLDINLLKLKALEGALDFTRKNLDLVLDALGDYISHLLLFSSPPQP